MPARITSLPVPANTGWKITNDVSRQALFDSAVRLVVQGGDRVPGEYQADAWIINLRSNEELDRGVPSLLAPMAKYGKLYAVDRDEIEGYRSVHQLLRDYLTPDNNKGTKPISIAVFGPPGSGKSFGVREVAESVRNDPELKLGKPRDPLVFNLAQFSEPEELGSAFLRIRSDGVGEEVPLAFFDEFDSSLRGVELGWLRYFLAPMEDGEFFYDGQRQQIGRAVLVFAGGTSSSLRSFSREENSSEQERGRFVEAKGPDFVSRLSGNINVLGVNRREDVPDQSYLLRRAVIIRSELIRIEMVGRTKRALVDQEFLERLLNVGRYKHGARSLKMILKMCIGSDGMLHLPPQDQLMMHVDKSDADMILS